MALPSQKESLNRLVELAQQRNEKLGTKTKLPSNVAVSGDTLDAVETLEDSLLVGISSIIGGPTANAKNVAALTSIAKDNRKNIYSIIENQSKSVTDIQQLIKNYTEKSTEFFDTTSQISTMFFEETNNLLADMNQNIVAILASLQGQNTSNDKVQLIQLAAGDPNVGTMLQSLQNFDEKSLEKIEKIVTELNKLNSIDLSKFRKESEILNEDLIKNLSKTFDDINKLYSENVAAAAVAAEKGQKDIEKINEANNKLEETIVEGKKPNQKQLKEAQSSYEGLASTIMAGAFAMIVGALLIKAFPDFPELALKFAGTFTLFLTAILVPLVLSQIIISKYGGDKGKGALEEIAGLITVCAFVMIIGALFMKIPGLAESALAFSKQLALFFIVTIGALSLVTWFINPALLESVTKLGNLIIVSTFVMLIGALFMQIDWMPKNALLFGLTLGLFVATILVPFILMSWIGGNKKFIDNIKGVSNLIVTCTIVMMIGALFMLLDNGTFVKNALMFGVVLSLFIALVILPFIILKPLIGIAEHTIMDVTKLIVVCTIVMLTGALFVLLGDGKFVSAAFRFTVVLALFVTGCILPILILKPFIAAGLQILKSLSLFVLVSAGVLFVGAYFVRKGYAADAFWFTVVFGAYLLAMIGIFSLLGVAAALVGPGAAVAAAMGLAIMLLAGGFALISIVVEKYKDTLDENLAIIGGWIWDIGLLFAKIALLSPGIVLGSIAIALMTPVLTALSLALLLMSAAAKQVAKMPNVSRAVGKIEGFFTLLDGFPSGLDILKMSAKIMAVTPLTLLMSGVLLTMSLAIAAISNLRVIEEWDNNGKPKKYRNLSESDFTNASSNVATIITTLGDALINVYDSRPDLFKSSKNSPIFTVLQASKEMGSVISNIASGLRSYANLMIPIAWNKDGTPIKFKQMSSPEIEEARANIVTILKTMAIAVSDAYYSIPGSTSEIKSRIEAFIPLGDLINSFAIGIQSYANLVIPTAWNKEGKPTNFKPMGDKDFTAAAFNIQLIMLTAALGLKAAYDSLITGENGIKIDDLGKFVDIIKPVGDIIANVVKALQGYANLNMATDWDKNGKPIKFEKFDGTAIGAVKEKIPEIMGALAEAVIKSTEDESVVKLTGRSGQKKLKNLHTLTEDISSLVGKVGGIVTAIADWKIPTGFDKDGKVTGYSQLETKGVNKLSENLNLLLTTIPKTIIETCITGENAKYFDETILNNAESIVSIFQSSADIINAAIESTNKLNDFAKSIEAIKNTSKDIEKHVSGIVDLSKSELLITDALLQFSNIASIMSFALGTKKNLDNVNSVVNKNLNDLKVDFDVNTINKIQNNVEYLNEIITLLAQTSKTAAQVNKDAFGNIGESFSTLNDYIDNAQFNNIETLKSEVDTVDKFVKAIDKVKVNNVMHLTRLLEQINQLSSHMGSLDKFTKVLAEQLASTLDQLTKQIRDAQRTIKDADRIQRQRHELINNSVAKVQKMMETTLHVDVTSTTTGSETTSTATEEQR